MSLVDWIYIIGGLVLLVVLVDGLRRMNSNWKQRVRLKVEADDEVDDRDEVALLRGELPNGGARVVRTEPFISSEKPSSEHEHPRGSEIEAPSETSDELNASVELESEEPISISPAIQERRSSVESPAPVSQPAFADEEWVESDMDTAHPEAEKESAKNRDKATSKIKSAVQKQLDFSDALFAKGNNPPPKKTAKPKAPEQIEDIIVIHIEIPGDEMVDSKVLIPLLQDNGVRHGEMGIFHRQDDRNIASTPLFSVANGREPGTFDLEAEEGFGVSGLTLFFTLPGPEDPVVALDEMIKLAEILRTELQADWLDSGRNPLNTQILEHLRQKVRDFKLQHPA